MEEGMANPPVHDPSAATNAPANLRPGAAGGGVPRILRNELAFTVMHAAALAFLTYNSAVAAYRARSDPWTLAFVVAAYSTLMLLFWCLRTFENAPPQRKERLKLAIWLLAMTLNSMFSYRVASMMPFGFAVVIWVIAGVTTVAGFYAFFVWDGDKKPDAKGSVKSTY